MRTSLTNEFRLALACAKWPPSDRRAEAVRRAAQGPLDWDVFLRVVKRHRIWGLAHDGLTRAAVTMPSPIARALAAHAASVARTNLALAAETIRLQRAFDEAGIAALFVKGAALAMLVHGRLDLRHSKDIDLLVSPDSADAAHLLIEKMGYRRIDPSPALTGDQYRRWLDLGKETEFVQTVNGVHLELHWRLVDNPLLLRGVDATCAARDVILANNIAVRTLPEALQFAYLCAHGAAHGWMRLKWLADISGLLAQRTDRQIMELHAAAAALGAGRCSSQALLLCEDLLGTTLPPSLSDALHGNRAARRLANLALYFMTRGGAQTEHHDAPFGTSMISASCVLLGSGARFYLMELRKMMINTDDWIAVPLPKSLWFLYPALRIPLWAWRRMRNWGRSPKSHKKTV